MLIGLVCLSMRAADLAVLYGFRRASGSPGLHDPSCAQYRHRSQMVCQKIRFRHRRGDHGNGIWDWPALPPVISHYSASMGWRTICLIAASIIGTLIMLIAVMIIRNTPESIGLSPYGEEPESAMHGEYSNADAFCIA